MTARQLGVAVMKLAAERSVETPIAAQVEAVLNQRQPVGDAYPRPATAAAGTRTTRRSGE
jgi:hypothetical protein